MAGRGSVSGEETPVRPSREGDGRGVAREGDGRGVTREGDGRGVDQRGGWAGSETTLWT